MKVLHILSKAAPQYGGPAFAVARTTNGLARLGVKSTVIGGADCGDQSAMRGLGWYANPAVDFRRVPRSVVTGRWGFNPKWGSAIRAELADTNLVHLHMIWDFSVLAGLVLAQPRGVPVIISPHGSFSAPWRYGRADKRIYLKVLHRWLLSPALHYHALNEAEAEGIRAVGFRGQIKIIPNALPPTYETPTLREFAPDSIGLGQKYYLYLGRISEEKNLPNLILAWKDCIARRDHRLVLAGPDDTSEAAHCRQLIEKAGLSKEVTLCGPAYGKHKAELLANADGFCLVSLSEGMSTSLLEALEAGVPTLTTRLSDLGLPTEARVAVCCGTDHHDIHEGLNRLHAMSESEKGRMSRAAACAVASRFEEGHVCQLWASWYSELAVTEPNSLGQAIQVKRNGAGR